MKRLYLTITDKQKEKLVDYLKKHNYSIEWETDDVILVDEEELPYIITILYECYIPFTDGENDEWFKNNQLKNKLDVICSLASEILDSVGTYGQYSDEEVKILRSLADVIEAYEDNLVKTNLSKNENMHIVRTWCENTKEGMDYLNYNGYEAVCRLSRKLWLVKKIGNVLDDIYIIA